MDAEGPRHGRAREGQPRERPGGALPPRVGDDGPVALKNPLDQLLARRLSGAPRRPQGAARRDLPPLGRREPRQAADRGSPPGDRRSRPAVDLPRLRARSRSAAPGLPDGPLRRQQGLHRPRLEVLEDDPASGGWTWPAFKRRLAEANNARLLDLSRADLVQAMDPEDVRLSEVAYLNATFHFIRIEPERH